MNTTIYRVESKKSDFSYLDVNLERLYGSVSEKFEGFTHEEFLKSFSPLVQSMLGVTVTPVEDALTAVIEASATHRRATKQAAAASTTHRALVVAAIAGGVPVRELLEADSLNTHALEKWCSESELITDEVQAVVARECQEWRLSAKRRQQEAALRKKLAKKAAAA